MSPPADEDEASVYQIVDDATLFKMPPALTHGSYATGYRINTTYRRKLGGVDLRSGCAGATRRPPVGGRRDQLADGRDDDAAGDQRSPA